MRRRGHGRRGNRLAGGGGGGGGPTATKPAYHLETDTAAVTTIDAAIDAQTTDTLAERFGTSRLDAGDGVTYVVNAPGSAAAPSMEIGPLASDERTPLVPIHLDGNIYRFDDAYMSSGTNYKAIVLLIYDTGLTGSDYHYWGIWLRQPAEKVWDDFQPFGFTSRRQSGSADLAAAEGSFTYTGEALGIYTKDGSSAGYFTARTSLTVNYGTTDDKFTLTGTIDNFVLSGQEEDPNWLAEVTATPRSTDSEGNPSNPNGNVWSGTADGTGKAGVFDARFFGAESEAPTVIQAEFKAFFTDGAVNGALFGKR